MPILAQKKALVTGGSRGIGAGIVKALAERGADVGFTYRTREDAASKVREEAWPSRDCNRSRQHEGGPADKGRGRSRRLSRRSRHLRQQRRALLFKPFDEFTLQDFDEIVSLDLRAAFVGSKAALPHMEQGGRIIFISSNVADYAALPMTSFYSMVKSGLDGLCKGMARDLGQKGITVNSVHPGPISTDANPEDGQYSEDLKRLMATPRYGTPADVGAFGDNA